MSKTILIVDDDPTTRHIVQQNLKKAGYGTQCAANGAEGLDVVNREPVDLIILDIIMPVMDGVDMFTELKKLPHAANIPIIILTESKIIEDSFRKLGINDFMAKPHDSVAMLKKIEQIFLLTGGRSKSKRVLIIGAPPSVEPQMKKAITGESRHVWSINEGKDAISNALSMMPTLIIIDVLLKDLSPSELIRALRCFSKLRNAPVLFYNFLSVDDARSEVVLDRINSVLHACRDLEKIQYMGRYEQSTFFDSVFKSLLQLV